MQIFIYSVALVLIAMVAKGQPLSQKKEGKAITIQTQQYKSFSLTENCFKTDPPQCDALTATRSKVKVMKSKIPLLDHPAAKFCRDHGGLNRILQTKEGAQIDYCEFKDNSMISAWDLYYHFFPKTK